MDSISQVSSITRLGMELENRAQWQSYLILPETCQHVLMSCHTECGVLAHWMPVHAVTCTIREHSL